MADVFVDSVLVETTLNGEPMEIVEDEKGMVKALKTTEKENGKEDHHTNVEDEKPNADDEGDSKSLVSRQEHDSGKISEEQKDKRLSSQGRGKTKTAISEDKLEGKASEGKKRSKKEPATPSLFVDRPARERKSIDRFVASVEKEKVRELKIEKGAGTLLKDIPNVVYMVSKKTGSDDSLQLLHKLLYGKRVKPHHAKQNILQFSGYVWGVDQEKEMGRVKERLEKCNKDSLLQVCELLDLSVSKSGKKEDVVAKLFEFLESPAKTSNAIADEKMKGKKRKKRLGKSPRGKGAPSQTPRKRQKSEGTPKQKKGMEVEEDDEGDDWDEDDENEQGTGKGKRSHKASDDGDYTVKGKAAKQKQKRHAKTRDARESMPEESSKDQVEKGKSPTKVIIKSPSRPGKTPGKSSTRGLTKSETPSKVFSRKKQQDEEEEMAEEVVKESPLKGKPSSKLTTKETEKSKKGPKKFDPSDEELRAAICDLLEEADFSKDTFADVIKKLEKKFNFDLSQKKAHVKILIQEEISKIAEADDEEEEDNAADEEGEGDKEESDPGDVADQTEE